MDLGNESGAAAPRLRRRPRAVEVVAVVVGAAAVQIVEHDSGDGRRLVEGHGTALPGAGARLGLLRNAMQCRALCQYVLLCHALQFYATQCNPNALQFTAMPCGYAMQRNAKSNAAT